MKYEESYYKSLNYTDYLNREKRYKKLCNEIICLLKSISLIKEPMLDYGCAVGFFLKELVNQNLNAVGFDISEWAIKQCKKKKLPIINDLYKVQTLFALDVFEHMHLDEIKNVFEKCDPNLLICRIPVSVNNGKSFALQISNKDPTHITCLTKKQWILFLKNCGYEILFNLNLCTIYDTDGVFCFVARRRNNDI